VCEPLCGCSTSQFRLMASLVSFLDMMKHCRILRLVESSSCADGFRFYAGMCRLLQSDRLICEVHCLTTYLAHCAG